MNGDVQETKVKGLPGMSPALGVELGNAIVKAVRAGNLVRVDLSGIERMTPSVANAIVLTVIEAVGEAQFGSHVLVETESAEIQDSWDKAVARYRRGIRLSTQRPRSA